MVVAPAPISKSWIIKTSILVVCDVTTLLTHSSTNLFICQLTDESLKSLGYSNFARHYFRNRCLLSLPRGTKMFQFPRLPPHVLWIQTRVYEHDFIRVSPFGYLRFKACLAAPRSLSQPTTSFFGILCQGIHYVHLSNFLRLMRQTYGFSHRCAALFPKEKSLFRK